MTCRCSAVGAKLLFLLVFIILLQRCCRGSPALRYITAFSGTRELFLTLFSLSARRGCLGETQFVLCVLACVLQQRSRPIAEREVQRSADGQYLIVGLTSAARFCRLDADEPLRVSG